MHGQDDFNPYEALTDGDLEAGTGHNLVTLFNDAGEKTQGYAVIDLGKAYTITSVGLLFWVNHRQLNVLVQVANTADFSDAVTLYNSDAGNVLGQGIGYDEALQDVEKKLNIIERAPVRGRYVRVTGKSEQRKCSDFNEVAVYAVTDGLAPVAGNLITEKQSPKSELTLTTEHDGATIRYTTDGSIPGENSAEYTAPIKLSSVAREKALIRAVAVKDGVCTIPSDFKFDIKEELRNVALGILPTFDEGDEEKVKAWTGNKTLASVTDGVEDSFNTMGTDNGSVWLYLDLGEEHRIAQVATKFWNDHSFIAVIQTATNREFTENVFTVFNNDSANVWGCGKGGDGSYKDKGTASGGTQYLTRFMFKPVNARYVRVRCADGGTDGRSSWEEIQVWNAVKPDDAYDVAAKNMAFGIIPTFDEGVTPIVCKGTSQTIESVTDGAVNPYHVMGTESGSPAWLYLDLGKEITVGKVATKYYHDWEFASLVQLSTTSDFSANVHTVYCNKPGSLSPYLTDIEFGEITSEDAYQVGMKEFTVNSVKARYLRVFSVNCRNADKFSAWEEIQVWSAEIKGVEYPEEQYPVVERAITKAKGIVDVTVPNGSELKDFAEKLPAQVEVEDYLGNVATLTGEWNCTTFSGTTAGKYEFTFDANETAWADIYGIMKINVTVAEAADKTALGALIEKAEALTESDYLPDTWAPLPDALSEAKTVFGGTKQFQAEIDKAQKALDETVKGLLRKGDKTDLNAAIDEAKALTESEYSAASWRVLAEKLAGATEVKNNALATQSAVDNALAELNAAIKALKKIGDKTELAARYNELKNTENKYTIATWTPFADALADAKAIVDSAEAYEDEIAKALAALNQTFAALELKSDMAALQAVIEKAEKLDLNNYTSATAEAVSASLEAAKAVSDDSEAEVITNATADLEEKLAALVARGNKTELNEYMQSCSYAADRYTVSTYNSYEAALEKAETVRTNADAVQSEIDSALGELKAAVEALKELANKTALFAAIEEAEKIEKGNYSSESYDAFVKALEYARSVANSNDASQADADGAIETLNSAKNALSTKKSGCGCGSNAVGFTSVVAAVAVLALAVVMAKRKGKKEMR